MAERLWTHSSEAVAGTDLVLSQIRTWSEAFPFNLKLFILNDI